MLQLRNRYHIEKRRIENLQAESPKQPAESKWPLYEQLSFLSDHIPVRRSFRNMNCRRPYSEFAVKNEQGSEVESDTERRDDSEYTPYNTRKGSIQVRNYGTLTTTKPERSMTTNSQPNAMRITPYPQTQVQAPPRLTRMPRQTFASRSTQMGYQRPAPLTANRLPYGADKFRAFGRFLTSSLIELPENEALQLVNQFTSELVHSYLKKHDQNLLRETVVSVDEFMETNGHGDQLQEE